MATGRSVFAYGYVRAYASGGKLSSGQVDSWLVVRIAARLSEGIEVEQPRLIAFLDRAERKATR
jgi:hypothetical protein